MGDAPPARLELVRSVPPEPVIAGLGDPLPGPVPSTAVPIMPGTSRAAFTLGALTATAFQGSDGFLYFTDLDGSVHSTFFPMSHCCSPVLVCLGSTVAIVLHVRDGGLWVTDGKGRAERLPGDEEHTGGM